MRLSYVDGHLYQCAGRGAAVSAGLLGITAFRLTTAEPERLARFYTEALGFSGGARAPIPADELAILGLSGGGMRTALTLGKQKLDLDLFERPGRPYPSDSNAADLCFQHFALLTHDAHAAWHRAKIYGALPISNGGPVTLPAAAGGVTAFKFRDPDGHPLEFLEFPADAPKASEGGALLGIDHSAISVADAEVSRRFYEVLGLKLVGLTVNHGPTQIALDALKDAIVDVVSLQPPRGSPHLELLGYRSPRGRSARRLEANDIAATRIVWNAEENALIRDPDGHLQLLQAKADCSEQYTPALNSSEALGE